MIIAKNHPDSWIPFIIFHQDSFFTCPTRLLYTIFIPSPVLDRFFFNKKSPLRFWENVTHIHPRSHATPISIPLAIEPFEDTLSSGDGLASPELVQVLAHQSAETHEWLKYLGPVGWERLVGWLGKVGFLEYIFCLSTSYVDLTRHLGINIH